MLTCILTPNIVEELTREERTDSSQHISEKTLAGNCRAGVLRMLQTGGLQHYRRSSVATSVSTSSRLVHKEFPVFVALKKIVVKLRDGG